MDAKGHFLTKEEQPTAHGKKFTRELRESKPSLSGSDLLAAYENGLISRDDYLACTRETRVYDETKTRGNIKKDPGLLLRLRPLITKGGLTASIYHRPHKG
jgi:hypothetical protein